MLILWLMYRAEKSKRIRFELEATIEKRQRKAMENAAKALFEHEARALEKLRESEKKLQKGKDAKSGEEIKF